MPKTTIPRQLLVVVAILSLGLVAYSQAVAYWGDESLHLVAGQLIAAGQRPYSDFFYQHPPLFAYLVAGLLRVFGENWRVVHLFSALLTSGSVLLTGIYVYARARVSQSAVIAMLLLGLNAYVISFGTVALPYAFCLFVMVAAFVLATETVSRSSWIFPFTAGASAGAAAASYLLTAPAIPVLLLWLLCHNQIGSRARKAAWYLVGVVLPSIPLLWLAAHTPRQVWFDLVQYHLFHRAGRDLDVWFNGREIEGWFISIQGTILVVFALAGLVASKRRAEFGQQLKRELSLAAWISLSLCLLIAIARPVSSFYFLLITPFVAISAAFGIADLCFRVKGSLRVRCVILIALGYVSGLSAERYIWRRQTSYTDHRIVRSIARIVDEVTPPAGMIYAFEAVYFEAHRLPPPGLENRFNPESQADEWLKQGRFDTVCIGSTNPRLREFDLLERYRNRQTVTLNGYDFYVLWGKAEPADVK